MFPSQHSQGQAKVGIRQTHNHVTKWKGHRGRVSRDWECLRSPEARTHELESREVTATGASPGARSLLSPCAVSVSVSGDDGDDRDWVVDLSARGKCHILDLHPVV
jgi:hypothetical protein